MKLIKKMVFCAILSLLLFSTKTVAEAPLEKNPPKILSPKESIVEYANRFGTDPNVLLKVAETAQQLGISCEIIDLRTLLPWDHETVLQSVVKTGKVLITHEAPVSAIPSYCYLLTWTHLSYICI
jgi:deoxyxylulose-5-phosphate synthase